MNNNNDDETKNVVIYDDIVKTWKDVLVLKNQPSNLQSECFKLFSAIANCTEETFMKYLKVIKPHLINAFNSENAKNIHRLH